MKSFLLMIFLSFLAFSKGFAQPVINFSMENERDENFKKKREEWLRSLHRCEEGLPYWILDQKSKEAIELFTEKTDQKSSKEFANGRIIGEWFEKGSDNLAGRVHIVDYDTISNTIYLASAGGNIWKGTINGNDWICLNNSKKFSNPRIVKILNIGGKQRIIVVANSPASVYFTDDDGKNWQKAKGFENAERWGWTVRGAVSVNQEVYVLLNEWNFNSWKSMVSLYKSVDYCQNFSRLYSVYIDYDLCDIWSPKYHQNLLFFVVKDTLYKIDSQNNFTKISINSFIDKYVSGVLLKGFFSVDKNYLYLAVMNNNAQTIFYYSTDGGKNFVKTGKFDFYPFEKNSFEVSNVNPENLYFGQVEFYRSTDFGSTWKRANSWTEYYQKMDIKLHADIPGIVSFRRWNPTKQSSDEILFVCTDGGVYLSTNQGITFKNLSLKNLNISQYYSIYTFDKSGEILIAGSQDQGLQFNLHDSGKVLSFTQVISGDYGHLTSSNGGRYLWTTYPGFAMLVIDPQTGKLNERYWQFKGGDFLWLPPIVADPDYPTKAYLLSGNNNAPNGTPASFIYELTYNQFSDSIEHKVIPYNFALDKVTRKISALSISQLNTDFWFALTNDGKFFRSFDRGKTWELIDNVAGPNGHYFYGNKIITSNFDIGKIVIAGSGYSNPGVLISYDTGKTFTPLNQNIPSTLFYDIEFNEDESLIFAATEIGPFVYHFPEKKWYFLGGNNCPDNIFWDVEYLPSLKTARYATYGRGIWDFKIEKVLSEPLTKNLKGEELSITIKQNTSNDIIIEVKCEIGSYLTIDVYDIEGRLVKTFWNGFANSENLCFFWNGTTDNNRKLARGKYFCLVVGKSTVKYAPIILQ